MADDKNESKDQGNPDLEGKPKNESKDQGKKAPPRYICAVRCVYQGHRYKPGETLVTADKDVPEYFTPV